jgi:hypothetical protein
MKSKATGSRKTPPKKAEVASRPFGGGGDPFGKFIGALSPKGQPDGTAVAWVRKIRDQS